MKLFMVYQDEEWYLGGDRIDSIHTDFEAAKERGDEMNAPCTYVREIETGQSYESWIGCPKTECQYIMPPPPPPRPPVDLGAMSPIDRIIHEGIMRFNSQIREDLSRPGVGDTRMGRRFQLAWGIDSEAEGK